MAIANYSILLPLIKQKQERYLYTTVLKKNAENSKFNRAPKGPKLQNLCKKPKTRKPSNVLKSSLVHIYSENHEGTKQCNRFQGTKEAVIIKSWKFIQIHKLHKELYD